VHKPKEELGVKQKVTKVTVQCWKDHRILDKQELTWNHPLRLSPQLVLLPIRLQQQ
jgi:hypothetical protein